MSIRQLSPKVQCCLLKRPHSSIWHRYSIFILKSSPVRRIISILIFLCVATVATYAQKGSITPAAPATNGYCLMRVFDVNKFASSGNGFVGAKIIITYEDGKQEEVALQAFSEKTEGSNLIVIVTTLNSLKKKGYMLMSANSTGDQGNIVTDYVLLKQAY